MNKPTRAPPQVTMHEVGEDPFSQSIMFLVAHTMEQGVQAPGDSLILMVPEGIEYSRAKDGRDGPTMPMGEWEITFKKVS